jgi:putative ABC transport system permease protein
MSLLSLFRDLPIAWLQLSHGRMKLVAAVIGVVFADLLMWMQLGFLAAALQSATYIHNQLKGELVLLNPQSEMLNQAKPFPRVQLARVLGHPDVETAAPLSLGAVQWKDPQERDAPLVKKRNLFAYGIVPYAPAMAAPGVVEASRLLNEADTVLFDTRSRPEFAPVVARLQAGERVEAEVNGRRITVVGATSIGASFQVDGNLVTSDLNLRRLTGQPPGSIDLGVIRLRAGADPQRVKVELQKSLGPDLLVLTRGEYTEREKEFMQRRSPVNFVFTLGAAVGFLVGFAIVYQVLFTDVSNHLPQFATLKAIGYPDGYLRRVVLHEAFILSVLGYLPGTLIARGLYAVAVRATRLPMEMTTGRGMLIFGLTVVMCSLSGLLAMQKLRHADPADVF